MPSKYFFKLKLVYNDHLLVTGLQKCVISEEKPRTLSEFTIFSKCNHYPLVVKIMFFWYTAMAIWNFALMFKTVFSNITEILNGEPDYLRSWYKRTLGVPMHWCWPRGSLRPLFAALKCLPSSLKYWRRLRRFHGTVWTTPSDFLSIQGAESMQGEFQHASTGKGRALDHCSCG